MFLVLWPAKNITLGAFLNFWEKTPVILLYWLACSSKLVDLGAKNIIQNLMGNSNSFFPFLNISERGPESVTIENRKSKNISTFPVDYWLKFKSSENPKQGCSYFNLRLPTMQNDIDWKPFQKQVYFLLTLSLCALFKSFWEHF